MSFLLGKHYRKDYEELEKQFADLAKKGMCPADIYAKITQWEGMLDPDEERAMWVFGTLCALEGLK